MKKTSILSVLFDVKILLYLACLTLSFSSSAQTEKIHVHYAEVGEKLANLISQDNLKETVYTLASDEFEGRETGSVGIDKAADYIKNKLISYGIQALPCLLYTSPSPRDRGCSIYMDFMGKYFSSCGG
jgi:beta-lactamase superfamily II metal-dependent hydrolase